MATKRTTFITLMLVLLALLVSACGAPSGGEVRQVLPTATSAPQPAADQQPAATQATGQQPASADDAARRVRKLVVLSNVQAQDAREFELTRLIAEDFKQLGLDVEHRAMPWEQQSDVVWYQRDAWDMSSWQMVGRPERMDPDELLFNLFHSSTAEKGYNFIGYNNPEYDKLVEAQRGELDDAKRKELVQQAQELLVADQPYGLYIHPRVAFVYNNEVWEPSSIVEAKGIGIKNFWTFVKATPKGSQTDMVLNGFSPVKAINPLFISGGVDSWVTELVWDRLMRIDTEGRPTPWAAEKVEWKDQTTVEVTLREGMTWHDGQPVTVEDVVFSFSAPADKLAPMYKPFVSRIAAMETPGGNVVRFKLTGPYAAFETSSLSKVNLIPKHIWEPVLKELEAQGQNAETYQEEIPIGSGPFKFAHWKKGEEIMLEAYAGHFSAPKLNRWILRQASNVEAVLGQLGSGELNFLSDYTGDYQVLDELVKANPRLSMVVTVDVGSRFLAYNERRPPFDDPAFRRALSHAINRDAIVKQIYKGFAVPAESIVSEALDYWRSEELDAPTYDLERARAILKEAGYEWDSSGRLLYPQGKAETLKP